MTSIRESQRQSLGRWKQFKSIVRIDGRGLGNDSDVKDGKVENKQQYLIRRYMFIFDKYSKYVLVL